MISARSRHLWSDCLALSITWPPSHVSKFIFEKINEPFCYLSHPEVFFKHQSWAFPGSNPSCALWPRQPSLPIKQISKSLSISDLHSPPWAQGPELRRGENGQMEIYGDNTLTHPGQDCGLTEQNKLLYLMRGHNSWDFWESSRECWCWLKVPVSWCVIAA